MQRTFAENKFIRRAVEVFQKLLPGLKGSEHTPGTWESQPWPEVLARMEDLIAQRPIHLNLELNTACNAKCVFCAYPKVKRDYGNLSMELFKKICVDFANIGGGLLGLSALISDPLLDPHIVERIRYLDENHPTIVPHVFTNGIKFNFLSDDDVTLMLSKLQRIDISIGGLNREDYIKMFQVDKFDRVWESLERLARIRRERRLPCKLRLHFRTHKKPELLSDERFLQLKNMGYICEDVIDSFSDWGGIVKPDDLPEGTSLVPVDNSQVTAPCFIPMTYLSVLPDGRCHACGCFDTTSEYIVGDLNKQAITEVWQSPAYQQFRASFAPGKVYRLCAHCSFYKSYSEFLTQPRFKNYQPWQGVWPEDPPVTY